RQSRRGTAWARLATTTIARGQRRLAGTVAEVVDQFVNHYRLPRRLRRPRHGAGLFHLTSSSRVRVRPETGVSGRSPSLRSRSGQSPLYRAAVRGGLVVSGG